MNSQEANKHHDFYRTLQWFKNRIGKTIKSARTGNSIPIFNEYQAKRLYDEQSSEGRFWMPDDAHTINQD